MSTKIVIDPITRIEGHLRIEAMLRMDPVPEPVSFDSGLDLQSGTCRLSGGDDAR